jgi:hypothetical protein
MKNVVMAATLLAFITVACNNSSTKTNTETSVSDTHNHNHGANSKVENDTIGFSKTGQPTKEESKKSKATVSTFPINDLLKNYLELKTALTKDDAKGASMASSNILSVMAKVDMKSIGDNQMKTYMDIADDLKENAEHIRDNAGKIDHQREHFEILSKDVNDLIDIFGTGGIKLYQDFCPMYNDGKGAMWISEIKEIKNPYYGNKMLSCGSVKKEY